MAKAFTQLYAETESLLGSHMHNFETLQQSGILSHVPHQMQQAVMNGLNALKTKENMLKNSATVI
jgi:hypothetical protein